MHSRGPCLLLSVMLAVVVPLGPPSPGGPHPVSGIERRSLCPLGYMVMAYRRVTRIAEPCIFGPVLAWLGSSSGSIRLAGWRT